MHFRLSFLICIWRSAVSWRLLSASRTRSVRKRADVMKWHCVPLGIQRTVMLTGDSERTAAAIAAEVGVDDYRAEVLPEDKANFVEQERAAGHTVIMLGDGINDSPALSAANVGVAISDGAAIAREDCGHHHRSRESV